MIPKTKALVCVSGGADSVTALYIAVSDLGPENVGAIGFDYKAPHNSSELNFMRGHCHRLGVNYKISELPALGGLTEKNWIVPFRNGVMLLVAANFAVEIGADSIIIGCNKDDADYPFPDCSEKFISDMNNVAESSGYDVEIRAPFINMRKWEIIGLAREHGVPLNELWTCYQPKNGKQCGECPACKKLKSAINHK